MGLFEELREKYPVFTYQGYQVTEDDEFLYLAFDFAIDGLSRFRPAWTFVKPPSGLAGLDRAVLDNMAFSLGMAELVSYWKLTCSPAVRIACTGLDSDQIRWWKTLYFGGLGEFFYKNGIRPSLEDFMNIQSGGAPFRPAPVCRGLDGCLIPVGGGKDSAVTLELLSEERENSDCYIINQRGASLGTALAAGYPRERILTVQRTLDGQMLELNRRGFLNGHTPFSAIVAFSSLLQAYLFQKKTIVLSNESSANESTVPDSEINHQYSKGIYFERAFRKYTADYIGTGIEYFSLLRPLTELQIAMLFSSYPKYHSVFKSCNAGSKTDVWCCRCPKCLFVYLILSPFLSQAALEEIFKENLLEKEELREAFDQLTGILPEKPFECVGSRDEILEAASLTVDRIQKEGGRLPCLLSYFLEKGRYRKPSGRYFSFYDADNCLPMRYRSLIINAVRRII